ncbi:SURF1 family protein [Intrasporangium calvum]|uniref:SURF1-like protein n=1 Tax=Intrasporangium calvum TaxID=53358 RepID=A0ABT5GGX2_9MICO|nr:SURF1 family protein [Intrasporangium calvum]MDC5696961.1 SURF1 family protein [Intrasporangium calvum]
MLRGLLTPRWVGLTIVMLLAVTACVFLGLWQLGVAQDEGRKEAVAAAAALPRAPLEQVTSPHSAFEPEFSNRPVSATGSYAAELGFVVPDRRLGGRVGSWVVGALETPEGVVPVLRGFVEGTPAAAPAPPEGTVTVLGTLGPGESPRAGAALPEGQRTGIDLAELVNEWPGDLYNVVLLAASESAESVGSAVVDPSLSRVPPPDLDTPLNFKNLAYAIQWWVFGLFAIWMWWKMFRAEQQPAGSEPVASREDAHA